MSFQLDEPFHSDDFLRRQRSLHNSDIHLNITNSTHHRYSNESMKSKRQKSNKYRVSADSTSLLSLPAFFSPSTLTNDSSITLVGSANQSLSSTTKRMSVDETVEDADDEKDIRDDMVNGSRHHRYYRQLSTTTNHRIKQQCVTSEEDDEDMLLRNHRGMVDFMDRVRRLLIDRKYFDVVFFYLFIPT